MLRAALVGLLAVSSVAVAAPSAADKRRAAELAAQSAEHYKRGELEVAVALLRQAYELYPQPNLLYNLGLSLEKLGDAKGAIDAYQQYLADAKDVADRAEIEQRIAALKAQLPAEPAKPPPPAPVAPPVTVARAPAPMPIDLVSRPEATSTSPLPWVTIGAGIAIAGTGGAFAYLASHRHDDAVNSPSAASAASLQTQAQHDATAANVLFAVGGAVAIAGIVWEIHDHHRASRVAVQLSPTGVMLSWQR
ncbi:MAG TPA: hypothetical protein VGL61_08585 [Kofleriaceae bacterium]|jgi:tetratricopeptide (TPR) repeat protein